MSSRQYFDAIAGEWDEIRRGFFSDSIRTRAIALAEPRAGMLAVDLGAGTGFISEGLLDLGLRVIAVDQSPAMIAELERKFAGNRLLECRRGDALDLPIADGIADCAFANMYIHHVEVPALAIREIGRIVKPGGRVVITDIDKHDHEFLRTEQHDRWLGFRREDIAAWLQDAGFEAVKVECAVGDCCSTAEDGGDKARITIFAASGTRRAESLGCCLESGIVKSQSHPDTMRWVKY
jgi:SAM-dependent methyltransferase